MGFLLEQKGLFIIIPIVKVGLGLTAGTLGCCVNIPFDVAKSRIQGPKPEPGRNKYQGTARAIATVYREEGWVEQN